MTHQPGITAAVPKEAIYLNLSRLPGTQAPLSRQRLLQISECVDLQRHVLGLSAAFCNALNIKAPGLRTFVQFHDAKVDLPITQSDIWLWLRGDDRGELFQQAREISRAMGSYFSVDAMINAFRYRQGRDLTGFEDGTENPKGVAARRAAISSQTGSKHSSFVAVQSWQHHLARFDAMSSKARNDAIGRDLQSNQELDDAPISAHVKRTAQESFTPEAFVLRRSMPWTNGSDAGLMFVAFGHSFDAFEAQLRRMSGAEDGVVDGLFGFSRPVSGAYFWCPPLRGNKIVLDT